MIELENVTKRYGNLTVYENFCFAIEEGKITCVLGESGSGKTTLLNMIASLTPYEGRISGVSGCSYVFQQPRLLPNLTAAGNLKLVCRETERVQAALRSVGLADMSERYPSGLSGGQAQRVALARAFLFNADVMLLDEPFSSLDLKIKLEVMRTFFDLQQSEGRTALFVTHDIDEAVRLSNRIVVLKGGKISLDTANGEPFSKPYGSDGEVRRKLLTEMLK